MLYQIVAKLNWVRLCSLSTNILMLYSTLLYFAVLYSSVLYCTVPYSSVLHAVLCCTVLYCTEHCTTMQYTEHCTTLHYTEHCTTMQYTEHCTTMQYTFSPWCYIIHSKICRAIPVWSSQLVSGRDLCTTCLYRPDQLSYVPLKWKALYTLIDNGDFSWFACVDTEQHKMEPRGREFSALTRNHIGALKFSFIWRLQASLDHVKWYSYTVRKRGTEATSNKVSEK